MKKAYNQYITEDFLKSRENTDKPVQKLNLRKSLRLLLRL